MKEYMLANVNGIRINYEAEGEGPPILLLHGNGEDHRIFDRLAADLKKDHEVFSIDTRGHGESEQVDSFHYSDMVEDIAALIRELSIRKPLLYGFSDGGIVGLMLASKYPGMLSGLIASGPNLNPKGIKARFRIAMRLYYAFKKSPLVWLMLNEPRITDDDLAKIDIPVLITIAEKDIILISHAEHIADKIPGGRLIVVPNENHFSYVSYSDKLFPLISGFIEECGNSNKI
ncbi:MAG: alpha/beta hydrolase [Candidatus Methanoplasma sp.]|jgi:pimeloyl-ACP methyl ester carboxylesterase|nr:alpha/beta hydrolase [Candidatus Methanoplasma sp.]